MLSEKDCREEKCEIGRRGGGYEGGGEGRERRGRAVPHREQVKQTGRRTR
jgi:hypothetical protein